MDYNYDTVLKEEFARITSKNGMNDTELLAEMYYLATELRTKTQRFLDKSDESTYHHSITKEDLLDYFFEVVRQCTKLTDLINEV